MLWLWLPGPALAQAPDPQTSDTPARSAEGQAPPSPGPAEAPPQPSPATPPPPTIPSTAPPVFAPPRGAVFRPAATFELHPSVSLSEEYTDNFNLSRRNKQENFRTSLSPGLTLLINGAFVKGQVGLSLSATHDSLTDVTRVADTSSLLGQVSYEVTPRFRLTASDVLTRSDEPALADALSLRRERGGFTSDTFSLSADYLLDKIATREFYRLGTFFDEKGDLDTVSHTFGVSAGTTIYETNSVNAGYEYLTSQTSKGSDVSGHQLTASLARQLTSLASAGVSGSYALRTVTSDNSDGKSDFTIWSISFFSAYAIPGRWSLTSSVGFSRLESDAGADTNSVTTVTTFTYYLARAVATLSVDQGFSETFAQGESFGVVKTRGVRASLAYPLTPFIGGTASTFYRQNEFTGVGGGGPGGTEGTWGGTVSFSVQLLRWLGMGLEYDHTEATSSGSRRGYIENRARASLNASF
ncbi:MAG: hypothetical protein HY293_17790 [Planctomycetes bacterium]|nr:hypothetical protein [Planctomycetota bacterium]